MGIMAPERSMTDAIWTIKEIAEYLKLKEKTAYALVARGEIPGFKVGGSWRFRAKEIEDWVEEQSRSAKIERRRD